MNNFNLHLNFENKTLYEVSILFSVLVLFVSSGTPSEFQVSYAQSTIAIENNTDTNTGSAAEMASVPNTTVSESSDPANQTDDNSPTQIISNIRNLLIQTLQEYENQNYTEAEAIATEAYLDNYEYVEAPIAEKNQTLMETTEVMMREDLRQLIIEKAPTEEVKEHIDNINNNLDRAEELLDSSAG
jgi:hypothetical protein